MAVEFRRSVKHEGHSTGYIRWYGDASQGVPETIWASDGFKGYFYDIPISQSGWKCVDSGAVGFVETAAVSASFYAGQKFTFSGAGTFQLVSPFIIPADFDEFWLGHFFIEWAGAPTSVKASLFNLGNGDAANGTSLITGTSPAQTTFNPTLVCTPGTLAYFQIEVVASAAGNYVIPYRTVMRYLNTFGNIPFF